MANTDRDVTVEKRSIASLQFDQKNARAHNSRNVGMIERSLGEVGAGRSLLTAKDGTVIAGNATLEAAAAAGFEDVYVVRTNGNQLVVVQRDDLDANDDDATKLALYDNRTAELAEWQPIRIAELQLTQPEMLEGLFTDDEVADILKMMPAALDSMADSESEKDDGSFVAFKFGDYSGRVSKDVYDSFVDTYEREKDDGGLVMLDDVLRLMMGL